MNDVILVVKNGVPSKSDVSSEGYFRPESPWLPGTRKVNIEAVELTHYSATPPSAPSTPSTSSVHVSNIVVSWKGEQDKVVLRNISFDLDSVSVTL